METNRAIINLDPKFCPLGESTFEVKYINFPSKVEVGIRINVNKILPVTITARLHSSDDLMTLFMATDALREEGIKDISLFLPFVPYARQDRVMVQGESLSIRVFAKLLNIQNYESVTIFDPHSDVTPALINNCKILNNHKFAKMALGAFAPDNYVIVSPDSGAFKKVFKVCEAIGYDGRVALCNKVRALTSGQIEHLSFDVEDFDNRDVVIIDDICDGGATFIALAKELKNRGAGKIHLIISHGIFSKEFEILFNGKIDTITTTDSFRDIVTSDRVRQIKLADIMKFGARREK